MKSNFLLSILVCFIFILSTQAQNKRSESLHEWHEVGPIHSGASINNLLIDKFNSKIIYATTDFSGFIKSENGGQSWIKNNSLIKNNRLVQIAQSANGDLYVIAKNNFSPAELYKSTNFGSSFEKLEFGANNSFYENNARIACHPSNNNLIFISNFRDIIYTEDGGKNWKKLESSNPNCILNSNSPIHDIKFSPDNKLYVLTSFSVFFSDNPTSPCTYTYTLIPNRGWFGKIHVCSKNSDVIYAINSGQDFLRIYKSEDGGQTFNTFSRTGTTGLISWYSGDFALGFTTFPDDCDKFIIGSSSLYKYDKQWIKISEPHSDKKDAINYLPPYIYDIKINPNNPDSLIVATTYNGVFVCETAQAQEMSFTPKNENINGAYVRTFLAAENGEIFLNNWEFPSIKLNPKIPSLIGRIGDEIIQDFVYDFAHSKMTNSLFFQTYDGVYRMNKENTSKIMHTQLDFYSNINWLRYWESENDSNSLDSILFSNPKIEAPIATGNGIVNQFSGTLSHPQNAAKIQQGSVRIFHQKNNQSYEYQDFQSDGILRDNNNTNVGTINYQTRAYSINFNETPDNDSAIYASYFSYFNVGDTLTITSNNSRKEFKHVLTQPVNAEDDVLIQDLHSTFIFHLRSKRFTNKIFDELPNNSWREFTQFNTPHDAVFSNNGNKLYVVDGTALYRIENFRNIPEFSIPDSIIKLTKIAELRPTGLPAYSRVEMALYPNDDSKMLLMLYNGNSFNSKDFLIHIEGVDTAQSLLNYKRIELPEDNFQKMAINASDTHQILLSNPGNLFICENIHASNLVLHKQEVPFNNSQISKIQNQSIDGKNYIFLSTYGRGIWVNNKDIINSIRNEEFTPLNKTEADLVHVYPNPVVGDEVYIQLSLNQQTNFNIQIFDINGRMVSEQKGKRYSSGNHEIAVDVSTLNAGSYFMVLDGKNFQKRGKFVVLK
jgi:hypothetical protein